MATQIFAGNKAKHAFLNNVRTLGMGGAGVAAARGGFSYLYNPALLTKEKFGLTVPGIRFEFGKNFFDIIDYATENEEKFKLLDKKSGASADKKDIILDELRREAAGLDNIWYKASLVPSFGVVTNNIGISVYNITHLASKTDVGIVVPKIKIYTLLDIVISGGYGYHYNEKLALGANVKIINRRESPEFKVQVEQASGLKDVFNEGLDEMQKGKMGFGIDFGALYKLNEKIELAAVALDLIGIVGDNAIPLNLKFGMTYQYNKNLVLAADLEDFFNMDGDKFVNKIFLGGEYKLPVLSVRLGFGQGYPAAGIAINLAVMELAYTFYTRELTGSPGLKGEGYHVIGLNFGWL